MLGYSFGFIVGILTLDFLIPKPVVKKNDGTD